MTDEPRFEPRTRTDRRRQPTSPWSVCWTGGRRHRPRREAELSEPHFVDLIDTTTFVMAVLLLILTIVDGAATLLLLGAGCEEVNPAMDYLLRRGPLTFLLGKYALTTAALPFLLIFRRFPLFRTRFRVGYLLPIFVGLYLVLLSYQLVLMNSPPPWTEATSATKTNPRPKLKHRAELSDRGARFDALPLGSSFEERHAGSPGRVSGREL